MGLATCIKRALSRYEYFLVTKTNKQLIKYLLCLFGSLIAFLTYNGLPNIGHSELPRVIWMFWDTGFENAPKLQQMCLQSWIDLNPEYKIRTLNLEEAEKLIERKSFYSDVSWNFASIQAKSDIIRVELLASHGGIWVDATVRCNFPLEKWIHSKIEASHFFAYERKDSEVKLSDTPHISSWFLATTSSSYLIRRLRQEVRRQWRITPYPPKKYGYYWLHRIFRDLTRYDPDFSEEYNKVPVISANDAHCLSNKTSFMHKMTAPECQKRFEINPVSQL